MKITSTKYYRVSLLFPYVFAFLLTFSLMNATVENVYNPSLVDSVIAWLRGILGFISIIYLIGAIYWLIPYSVLIVFLWRWSKGKNAVQIDKRFIWSPVFLVLLMIVFDAIMSLLNFLPEFYSRDDVFSMMITVTPITLFVGYVFIGLSAWIYVFLSETISSWMKNPFWSEIEH